MGKVGNWFRNAWNKVKETGGKVVNWVKDTAVPAVKKYGGKIISGAGKVLGWLPGVPGVVSDVVQTIGDKIDGVVNVLPEQYQDDAKKIKDKIIDGGKKVQEFTQDVTDKAVQFKPVVDKFGGMLTGRNPNAAVVNNKMNMVTARNPGAM